MKDEWKGCERKKTITFSVYRGIAIDTLALDLIWLTRKRYC